jgi:hypothetical protein
MPERTEMLATYSFAKVLKAEVDASGDAKHAANKIATRNDIFQKDHFGFFEEPAPHCDTGTKNVAGIVIVNELQIFINLEF